MYNHQFYELKQSVIDELSKFGSIDSVTAIGRSSALVVFQSITAACKALKAYPGGNPGKNIQCYWYNKFMSKYKFLPTGEIK